MNALADVVAPPKAWHGIRLPGGTFALICILVVVGPLDWLARRLSGVRTWRWVTTAGWVGLIALLSVVGVTLFDRSPADVGSVQVVEQVDRAAVASAMLVGIESANQREIALTPSSSDPEEPAGWWQPALAGTPELTGPPARPNLPFRATDRSCTPGSFWVQPRERRLLRGRVAAPAPALIEASLRVAQPESGGASRLQGTIKNISSYAIKGLHIRTHFGVITPENGSVLNPGQSVQLDVPIAGQPFTPGTLEGRVQSYGTHGSRAYDAAIQEQDLWSIAPDLDGRAALRIDALLQSQSNLACIYAELAEPPAPVRLPGNSTRSAQSYQWLRAVVPLSQ